MAKTKVEKGAEETSKKATEKPTKTIEKKPRVAKQSVPVPEMVMSVMTKNSDGCTLQIIRNGIKKQFGVRMSKKLQSTIKEYLAEEFQQKRVKMVDYDGEVLKFNQRLQVV